MSTTLLPVTTLAQLDIAPSRPSPATARGAVIGEVDLATAPVLRDQLLGVLHDYGPDVLDVDLGGVTFLDCAEAGPVRGQQRDGHRDLRQAVAVTGRPPVLTRA